MSEPEATRAYVRLMLEWVEERILSPIVMTVLTVRECIAESAAPHRMAAEFFRFEFDQQPPSSHRDRPLFPFANDCKVLSKSIKTYTTTVIQRNMTNGLVNGSTGIESQFGG
jgi:hypothetical protein